MSKVSGVSLQSIKRYESVKDNNITLDGFNKIEVNVKLFVMRDMPLSRMNNMSLTHVSKLSLSDSLVSFSQNNTQ